MLVFITSCTLPTLPRNMWNFLFDFGTYHLIAPFCSSLLDSAMQQHQPQYLCAEAQCYEVRPHSQQTCSTHNMLLAVPEVWNRRESHWLVDKHRLNLNYRKAQSIPLTTEAIAAYQQKEEQAYAQAPTPFLLASPQCTSLPAVLAQPSDAVWPA